MLKKICWFVCLGLICVGVPMSAFSEEFVEEVIEETVTEKTADEISAEALDAYNVEGSLFEKITSLEQEKLIMKLEAERMKLDLELDALSQQKMKKQMEMGGMYGQQQSDQQQEIQEAKAELDAKIENLKKQITEMNTKSDEQESGKAVEKIEKKETPAQISGKYKLINVIGVGNQLQATIQDITTGQNKRIAVGKQLNGYTIKSISLNDGIVFEKDGVSENLNVGK